MLTQLPRVPSLIPSSFATRAIGRDVSITILTASSLNSGEKLFFGRGNYFTFPDTHPNGWTVRKPRGTSPALRAAAATARPPGAAPPRPAPDPGKPPQNPLKHSRIRCGFFASDATVTAEPQATQAL